MEHPGWLDFQEKKQVIRQKSIQKIVLKIEDEKYLDKKRRGFENNP